MTTQAPAHEILQRLFDVVVGEAKKNETLARKLVEAIGEVVAVELDRPAARTRKALDAPDLHAINVLRSFGELALRGKLEQVRTADHLRAVAHASGLVLSGSASRPKASRAELIDGIIAAAKHYDAQRAMAIALAPVASAP